MVKRETSKKILGVAMTIVLLGLILSVLIPPATAVYVKPGAPSASSVTKTNTITFNNVNLTIRGAERIPVEFLKFNIYNSANSVVAWVKFNITGTELDDSPDGKFTVTQTSSISNPPYGSGGSYYGYDEIAGQNRTGFGYGYGYGSPGSVDITLLYRVVYTTHQTGSGFYGKLLVNASNYTYTSAASSTFTVTQQSDDGGGTAGGTVEPPSAVTETTSQDTLDEVSSEFGVTLSEPFYVTDTDGDGVVDFFVDPNGVLVTSGATTIGDNQVFLLSSDDDDDVPEFFWDPTSDTVTKIEHHPTAPTDEPYVDEEQETVTVTVTINKSQGWVYIGVDDRYPPDEYPDYSLTVTTEDGRTISADKIFRKNGKIYVLDDPDTQYAFIYSYDILPPEFTPPSGTTIDTSFTPIPGTEFDEKRPAILITYQEAVTLISAYLNGRDITGDVTMSDSMSFVFTPSYDLANGDYTLSITVEDANGNQLTSDASYSVSLPYEPSGGLPWMWIIIIIAVIILAIILILVFLFKSGRLYFEE